MIDVVIAGESIKIVLECEESFMSKEQAEELVRCWASKL